MTILQGLCGRTWKRLLSNPKSAPARRVDEWRRCSLTRLQAARGSSQKLFAGAAMSLRQGASCTVANACDIKCLKLQLMCHDNPQRLCRSLPDISDKCAVISCCHPLQPLHDECNFDRSTTAYHKSIVGVFLLQPLKIFGRRAVFEPALDMSWI